MLVKYEYNDKIIADAELSYPPREWETVSIWGEEYIINHITHDVEIKMKPNNKKCVIEKIICTLYKEGE